jgi:hypothetical protein
MPPFDPVLDFPPEGLAVFFAETGLAPGAIQTVEARFLRGGTARDFGASRLSPGLPEPDRGSSVLRWVDLSAPADDLSE